MPTIGFPLRPHTRYALVVTDALLIGQPARDAALAGGDPAGENEQMIGQPVEVDSRERVERDMARGGDRASLGVTRIARPGVNASKTS